MCGIVGIVSLKKKEVLETVTNVMSHRGPDDIGFFKNDTIALGHRRLSILDLSKNGHQPMISPDNRYVLIYNGELYNHLELRSQCLSDFEFNSHSDTETLLYGLIKYGIDFAKKMNGIFAFAFYDQFTGDLFICRDQFGVKPLYYYHHGNELYFASELKAFLPMGINKTLDHRAISKYLYFLYNPGSSTPFSNVKKLAPGHYIKCNLHQPLYLKLTQYYEVPFTGNYAYHSLKEYTELLDDKLSLAVRRQMLSDVPVGFFLSGGLDSSAIVALARKLFPEKPMTCYTLDTGGGFDGFSDDLYYAKKVAKYLEVELEVVEIEPDYLKDFDKMIWHLDEPQADAAPLNVMNICKRAKEKGDIVLLGGVAGDDLFSGYRRHKALSYESLFQNLPSPVWTAANALLNQFTQSKPIIRRIKKIVGETSKSSLERRAGYYGWMNESSVKKLFNKSIAQEIEQYHFSELLIQSLNKIPNEKSALNQMLFWEIKYFLGDHNLNYSDKMSMSQGVEVRVPFLDLDLVDFSTRIPPELKMRKRELKYILNKTMEKYLPKEIIYRPKTGFGAPVRKWITKDLLPMIDERLCKSELDKWGIFDFDEVSNLINQNKTGKVDASYSIWALLSIQSWLEQFAK